MVNYAFPGCNYDKYQKTLTMVKPVCDTELPEGEKSAALVLLYYFF